MSHDTCNNSCYHVTIIGLSLQQEQTVNQRSSRKRDLVGYFNSAQLLEEPAKLNGYTNNYIIHTVFILSIIWISLFILSIIWIIWNSLYTVVLPSPVLSPTCIDTLQVLGIRLAAYSQRIVMLPYNFSWGFAGYSMEGCALIPYGPCISWINTQNFIYLGLQVGVGDGGPTGAKAGLRARGIVLGSFPATQCYLNELRHSHT